MISIAWSNSKLNITGHCDDVVSLEFPTLSCDTFSSAILEEVNFSLGNLMNTPFKQ